MSNVPQDVIERLLEAKKFGQFSDDFDQPLAKPIRQDIKTLLELLRAQRSNAEPVASPDGEDYLRLSKSGYTLRVGWGDSMRFVAASPKPLHELSSEQQKQWLDDAERLCDGWNRIAAPQPPADTLTHEAHCNLRFSASLGTDEDYCDCKASTVTLGREEYEALKKDAERYRWLRDKSEYGDDFYLSVPFESPKDTFKPHEVDAAIDRAIEQSKGGDDDR